MALEALEDWFVCNKKSISTRGKTAGRDAFCFQVIQLLLFGSCNQMDRLV